MQIEQAETLSSALKASSPTPHPSFLPSRRPPTANNHSITFDSCRTLTRASWVDQNVFKNAVHQAASRNA